MHVRLYLISTDKDLRQLTNTHLSKIKTDKLENHGKGRKSPTTTGLLTHLQTEMTHQSVAFSYSASQPGSACTDQSSQQFHPLGQHTFQCLPDWETSQRETDDLKQPGPRSHPAHPISQGACPLFICMLPFCCPIPARWPYPPSLHSHSL